jgi:hypothetical protein
LVVGQRGERPTGGRGGGEVKLRISKGQNKINTKTKTKTKIHNKTKTKPKTMTKTKSRP